MQRKAQDSAGRIATDSALTSSVHDVLRSPGQPLDAATRAFMEPRFAHDFSRVRVHTDGRAAESARAARAHAYTVGQNIVFGAGNFAPATEVGRRLLAHELTHTVQQRAAGGSVASFHEDAQLEANAEAAGREVAAGNRISQNILASGIQFSRQADPEAERKKAIEESNAVIAKIDAAEKEDETPAPGKLVRETNYTPPPKPKAPAPRPAAHEPRGYTPVPPEVVVEAYRLNPHVISESGSTEFHNQVWRHGGGHGRAPAAFRVGDMIRVNVEAFPSALRPLIGYNMYIGK